MVYDGVMAPKYTVSQISEIARERGLRKAPIRAVAMRNRYELYRSKSVRLYQEKLAKDLLLHLK